MAGVGSAIKTGGPGEAGQVVQQWPLSRFRPYDRNPRRNDHAVERVAAAIREFGFKVPVLARSSGELIDGHLRLKAATFLGLESVPVLLADDLTDAQVRAFRISVNRMAELAEWDTELLAAELDELAQLDVPAELAGWTGAELEEFDVQVAAPEVLADPEEVPEVKQVVTTRPGDLWLLGGHRLLCGSSTEGADVERLMGDQRADLLLTDPPYGVSYAEKNEFLNTIAPGNRIQKPIANDHRTPEEMLGFWTRFLELARDACTAKASYYIFAPQGGDLMMMMMMMSIERAKWQLKHMLVWVKNNHVLGRCDYNYKHEPVFYGWKADGTHEFFGDGSCVSTLHFDKPMKNDLHPTMKPVALIAYLMGNNTRLGGIALDPFLGSGTTLIAAEQLGRKCYGLELDPGYCDVIVRRWEGVTGKQATLEATGETFAAVAAKRSMEAL